MKTPTLLITVPNGTVITSLLMTGMVDRLAARGFKVVLLVPEHSLKALKNHYTNPQVHFEILEEWSLSKWGEIWALMARAVLAKRFKMKTLHLMEAYNFHMTGKTLRRLLWKLTPGWHWLEKLLVRKIRDSVPSLYSDLIKRHEVTLLFSNNPFMSSEYPVVLSAECSHIPVTALCHSWDNLTSRGPMIFVPDTLLTWNRINAEEAAWVIDGMNKDRTKTIGVPLFDIYERQDLIGDREEFFKSEGLDPEKRLITFTGVTERSCPLEVQKDYVRDLAEACRDGRLANAQVYFRMHPKMPTGQMKAWCDELGVKSCFPRGSERFDDGWIPDDDDLAVQARTITFSDLCLNVASSMTIHCAITGTRVVCPTFDGHRDLPYEISTRRVYDYEHNVKVMKYGYAQTADSPETFIDTVREVLENPVDETARQRLVTDYVEGMGQMATHRLEQALVHEIECLQGHNDQ